MAHKPYKNARQEHLADALDDLKTRNLIAEWRMEFSVPPGKQTTTALWWITATAEGPQRCRETRPAEQYVMRLYGEHGLDWEPVPHPGGEDQAAPVHARLARRESQGADVLGATSN